MVLSRTNRALKGKEGKKWAIESQLKMRYEGGEGYMRDTCMAGLKPAHLEYDMCMGPAPRCDATHSRQNVLKPLRCMKIACDALRCIFQHVGNFAPDGGISQ